MHRPSVRRPVKFVDSSFWGPSSQIARLSGEGTTTFSSCEFVTWDMQKKDGRAAISADGGALVLQGNTFAQDKQQVALGTGVKKAIILGNILAGAQRISVASNRTNAQIGYNA